MSTVNLEDEDIIAGVESLENALLRVESIGLAGCRAAMEKLLRDGFSVAQVRMLVQRLGEGNLDSDDPSLTITRAVEFLLEELDDRHYWQEFFVLHGDD